MPGDVFAGQSLHAYGALSVSSSDGRVNAVLLRGLSINQVGIAAVDCAVNSTRSKFNIISAGCAFIKGVPIQEPVTAPRYTGPGGAAR